VGKGVKKYWLDEKNYVPRIFLKVRGASTMNEKALKDFGG
tara:strand:+ start:1160 stop:1279 length:120 start_codon:yes stop_codon:yes gene_type:complete